MNTLLTKPADHAAAVIWLDLRHAFVARAHDGHPTVTEVGRDADSELHYMLRVVREAADCDRVVIMGPDAARIDFEREYVTLYRRPDQLIDVGLSFQPGPRELIEQLELIEPSLQSS
jgi:hypothetical protein